jgi:flavin reductase (DIM6/NTAB) family NADH-FMN oxidoreductase RutF
VLTTHRPSVAADEFRAAMRQIPSMVTIVTTSVHGFCHGLTATAVASVSADPPQVLVCVHRATRSAAAISAAGRFGLNFLGAEHAELAEAFAAPTVDPEDRFRRARWTAGGPALPYSWMRSQLSNASSPTRYPAARTSSSSARSPTSAAEKDTP